MRYVNLWRAYRESPDDKIRDEIFVRYFDWAVQTAATVPFRLPDCGLQQEDVQGLVAEELMGCIERFDLDRNIEFEAFSRKRIRGVVLNAISHELKHIKGRVKAESDDAVVADRFQEATLAIENLVVEVLLENFVSDRDYSPDGVLFRDSGLENILESALATLTRREFEAIHSHFFADEAKSVVAEELGVSRGRISQLLAMAYKKLRAALLKNADIESFF